MDDTNSIVEWDKKEMNTCGCGSCGCGKDEGLKIERKAVSEMDGVS
jgi:hypothetical protein